MKKLTGHYLGMVVIGWLLIVGSAATTIYTIRRLFLPEVNEVLIKLFPSVLMLIAGIALIAGGFTLSRRRAGITADNARKQADSYNKRAYNYDSAEQALRARAKAWQTENWGDSNSEQNRKEAVEALEKLANDIDNLEKMSDSVSMALGKELKYTVLGAVARIDKEILENLSRFITYCSNASKYELAGEYFQNMHDSVAGEVEVALDRYAKLHIKLTQYNASESDRKEHDRIKAEIDDI